MKRILFILFFVPLLINAQLYPSGGTSIGTITANAGYINCIHPRPDSASVCLHIVGDNSALIFGNGTPNMGSINAYMGTYKGIDYSAGNYYRNGVWYRSLSDYPPMCFFQNMGDSTFEFWSEKRGAKNSTITWSARKAWIDFNGGGYFNNARIGTATDNITIDKDSAVMFHGTATVWDDMMFPFNTGTAGGNPYPVFNADSIYYTFVVDTTGVTKSIIYMICQLPHSWKQASMIYPHIHYKQQGVGSPTFRLEYKWYSLLGTTNFAWSHYTMLNTTGTTNNTHQMCYNSTTGLSGVGRGISSILIVKCYLVLAATGRSDCNAWQLDFHYEKDGIGSKTEVQK